MPLITPGLVFVIVLSFVNSLKIFRESFLYFQSNYPPDAAYTVQFYMNNHFMKLDYPTLTAASVMFTVAIAAVLAIIYHLEDKYNGKIY
jgi:multiple sugar transport system permease protein